MAFDANQFLDGLFSNPSAAPAPDAPPAPTENVDRKPEPPVKPAADDSPEPEPAAADADPYGELIDRLNGIWPTECPLTEDGGRLLDAIFERVCDAQRSGDAVRIKAAVTAAERATRQLIAEQGMPDLAGLPF